MYTFAHSLSLHDALPISSAPLSSASGAVLLLGLVAASTPLATRVVAVLGLLSAAAVLPVATSTSAPTSASTPFPLLFLLPIFRSEEHTSELQSLMRISYAVFCLKKKTIQTYYA